MDHSVKEVARKEIDDETLSVRFRCCNDESTDSVCSLSLRLTDEELREALARHQTKMAHSHETKVILRQGKHVLSSTLDASIKI